MSTTYRRLAWIWFAVALTIAVQFLGGAPPAKAASPGTSTTTTTTGPSPTTTTVGATSTSTGAAAPDCDDVLAGDEQGSLSKAQAGGGDEQAGFDMFRIQTDRPVGVYHVVDCIRADQVFPNPAIIDTVDLGDVRVSGTATFRVEIPGTAIPGSYVCDRFVLSGTAGGVPFTDISNQVCLLYTGCLGFGSGTCPPVGGVESTTPRGGTLPFTGSGTLPLLLTGVALLGLGVVSLMAARWRYDRLNL
jgi:hypothetical protein